MNAKTTWMIIVLTVAILVLILLVVRNIMDPTKMEHREEKEEKEREPVQETCKPIWFLTEDNPPVNLMVPTAKAAEIEAEEEKEPEFPPIVYEEPIPRPEPEAEEMPEAAKAEPETAEVNTDTLGYDFEYVCSIIAQECGGECYDGQVAVAQCVLNTANRLGITPEEVVRMPGRYTTAQKDPKLVEDAVKDVFFNGVKVTEEPIEYMYSTRGGFWSSWHEGSCDFVLQIGDVKFFKAR